MGETYNADEYARYQILEISRTAYARTKDPTERMHHLRQFLYNLTYVLDHQASEPFREMRKNHCRWGEEEVTRMTLGHPDEIIDHTLEQLIQDALSAPYQNI